MKSLFFRIVCLFALMSYCAQSATVHTLTFMAGNGTTDDTAGLQNAINAAGNGGTVIVDQPPNFYLINGNSNTSCGGFHAAVHYPFPVTVTSALLFLNVPGAPSGAPMFHTTNGANLSFFICDDQHNTNTTGIIFDGTNGISAYGWNLPGSEQNNMNFSHNNVQNVQGNAATTGNVAPIGLGGIQNLAQVNYNFVFNAWKSPNGQFGFPGENSSVLFSNNCFATDDGCSSLPYGIAGNYFNHTTITNNKVQQVGGDCMSMDVAGIAFQSIQPVDGGYNLVADNEFIQCGRMGIEFVGGGASGENYNIIPDHNTIISGNYYHNPAYEWWHTFGFSFVLNGAWNLQLLNNTAVSNNNDCFGGNSGDAFEFAGNSILMQGNVLKALPGGCRQPGWGAYAPLGAGKLQTIGTTGNSMLSQNNIMCGPGASGGIGDDGNNGVVMGGPGSTNSTPGHAIETVRANSFVEACSAQDQAGALIVSNMALGFVSPANQTINGSGTFNVWVTDTLSIRHVNFYIDGSTTPIVSQFIQDFNPAFSSSTPQWLYHATISSGSLTNGTHTIKAIATDVTGTDSSPIVQSFTVSGGGGGCAITTSTLPAGTVATAYTATLAQSGCGSGNWSIASGALPSGLSLNPTTGVISGTPGVAGTSSFAVSFTTATSSDSLSITINPQIVGPCNTGTQNTVNGLYADTFAGGCIGPWWTFSDPLGGATATIASGVVTIAVPAGPPHDAYSNGEQASVLQQSLNNKADFTATVKFTSTPSGSYQGQGIIAIQDSSTFMRCEVLSSGTSTLGYSAFISGATVTTYAGTTYAPAAPYYVRLARAGSNWTCSLSHDGTTYTTVATATQALNISNVGITADTGTTTTTAAAFNETFTEFDIVQPAGCLSGTQNTTNGLYSDTFAGGCVGSWWTLQPGATTGTATVDSSGLHLSVPTSTNGNDAYMGGDQATVLTQNLTGDSDFTVTAAFSTTPTTAFESEGIQAIQDSNNFIRCEVLGNGSGTVQGVSYWVHGSGGVTTPFPEFEGAYAQTAPLYVRLARSGGSSWTCSASHDNVAWTVLASFTQAMTIAKVGITADTGASGGTAPAWAEIATSFTVAGPATVGQLFGGTPGAFGPVTTTSTFLPSAQTAELTSTVTGSFTLAPGSSGTLTTIDSKDATYTAPASVNAQHVSGGCMVQPNDSIFNTRIDSLPVSSHSAQYTNTTTPVGSDAFPPASAVPFTFGTDFARNIIDSTTPTTAETFVYTTAYNGQQFQIPAAPNKREHGTYAHTEGTTPTDHHLVSINHQTCTFYETYNDALTSYAPACSGGGCTATSGWKYGSMSYAMPALASGAGGTSDAAGLPLAPLTLHGSEVLESVRTGKPIGHALRFTANVAYIALNGSTAIWPATNANGGTDTAPAPIGTRFRLKSGVNTTGLTSVTVSNPAGTNHYTVNPTSVTVTGCTSAPTLSIAITSGNITGISVTSPGSGCTNPVATINGGTCSPCATATANTYSPYAQAILTDIKQEGLVLADNGLNNQIIVDADMTSDPNTFGALKQIEAAALTMANMEAVDQTSFEVAAASTEVAAANASGQAAQVVFTPTSGSPTIFPIALQAITIGVAFEHAGILAGEAAYTIPYWVNGDPANAGVTWAIGSCSAGSGNCGSITSAGAYAPPAIVTPGTSLKTTLVATSVSDTNQSKGVFLTIYPAGTLRIDSGASTTYTDTASNVWLPEQWGQSVETLAYPFDDDTFDPNGYYTMGTAGTNPNIKLFQTGIHGLGGTNGAGDIYFSPLIVPNGTYDVTLDFALTGQNNGPGTCPSSYNPTTQSIGPLSLITQGMIQAHNWDPGLITQNLCRRPASVDIPAIVSDRLLKMTIATDATAYNEAFLNAYSVASYTSPAKWVIDTQQKTQITPNNTLQMYVQDWAGKSDPVWSIVQGPGSISLTGLYTAPTSQPVTAKTTVKACSSSQPTLCATADLIVVGARFAGFL